MRQAKLAYAEAVPTIRAGIPYADARASLTKAGYVPFHILKPGSPAYRTNIYDRSDVYALYPEVEACGGTGLADCAFVLTRARDVVIVHTTGEHADRLVVANVKHATQAQAEALYEPLTR